MNETQIESIKIARMGPQDVLVLTCSKVLSAQQREHMRAAVETLGLPGRVIVLDGGVEASIISPSFIAEPAPTRPESSLNLTASAPGKAC